MKKLFLVFLAFTLTGCFIYSAKDDCIYGLTSTQCFGEKYPIIAEFQKPHSLGKTNAKQRWDAVVSCGGKYGDRHLKSINDRIFNARHGNGNPNDKNLDEVFKKCMASKGYILVTHCGRKNSTTDKGICNE